MRDPWRSKLARSMGSMIITDGQVHVWGPARPDRPWIPDGQRRLEAAGHRASALGYEEYRQMMGEAGVQRALLTPPSWEGDRIDIALQACKQYPGSFRIIARVPPAEPHAGAAMLANYAQMPFIKGIRLTFLTPEELSWLDNGIIEWYWPLAEQLGMSTMIHAPGRADYVAAVARAHPRLRIAVDHMGVRAPARDADLEPWIAQTVTLARCENVYVKLSAIGAYSTHEYPHRNMIHHVRSVVDAIGVERCFWASDLSRLLTRGMSYLDAVEQFTKHFPFDAGELRWIMGETVARFTNWPSDSGGL